MLGTASSLMLIVTLTVGQEEATQSLTSLPTQFGLGIHLSAGTERECVRHVLFLALPNPTPCMPTTAMGTPGIEC